VGCIESLPAQTHQVIDLVFPKIKMASEELPERARKYLQQAYETLHAPDAAVVMAASAIDAMLKEKGYTKGTLYERIEKAVADHVLTENMGKWAHSVRLESNKPRHADLEEPHVSPDDAKQVVEFADALGDFLFVLSARISRGIQDAGKEKGR
jgi:hypothetical protein